MANPDFQNDEFFAKMEFNHLLENPDIIVPVRDQLKCCCWYSFAAANCISAAYCQDFGKLLTLSAQECVDCIHKRYPPKEELRVDSQGCSPSSCSKAFLSAKEYGLYLEQDYKYKGKKGPACLEPIAKHKMYISDHGKLSKMRITEEEAICGVLELQPLVGAITLTNSFRKYDGKGIYMGPTPKEMNDIKEAIQKGEQIGKHAILIVGHGQEDGTKFFLVKNSWGEKWGRKGFAKVKMDLVKRMSFPIGPHLKKK